MGKRTIEKTDDEIRSQIKRLRKELECRRKLPPNPRNEDRGAGSTPSYYENSGYEAYETSEDEYPPESVYNHSEAGDTPHGAVADVEPGASSPEEPEEDDNNLPKDSNDTIKSVVVEVVPNTQTTPMEEGIPAEILQLLGDPKQSEEVFGETISAEVSERWGKILIEGLKKDQREALMSKILTPENFHLCKAPKLNAEVAAVLNEPAKNRDKRLEKMQNQLGCGIAGLSQLISVLITGDLDKMEMLKKLSEISQILLDLHYENTINRRKLIIPILDKSFINIIQAVKRDKFLFGEHLDENIKASKSIERSSLQIKKSTPLQPSSRRQGNYRAPVRHASASGQGVARAYSSVPPQVQRPYPPPAPPASRRLPPAQSRRPPPPPPSQPYSRSQDRRGRR